MYILICRVCQVSRSSSMYIIALTATPLAWASMVELAYRFYYI